jgi:hypothetical protein
MTDRTRRPILFLDVDGPLLPFGGSPQPQLGVRDGNADTHLARLDPATGPRLTALACELVWATAWEDDANAEIAPRIGLPRLPVVNWPDSSDEREREDEWYGLHWKTRHLVDWAAGRPFVWVDDEITDADKTWVTAYHPTRTLLYRVESSRGLTDEDFDALDRWLRSPITMH